MKVEFSRDDLLQFIKSQSKYGFAFLLIILSTGCGFKRVGSYYFDSRCHRDLPGIWWGDSCPGPAADAASGAGAPTDPINGERPCALAINPSLCIKDGLEHSVWRSEARQAAIALTRQQ